jgi:hypothetical protein
MKRVKMISTAIAILVCLAAISAAKVASAIVLASDNASDAAYAFVADGAWKGQYSPTSDPQKILQNASQNPPGNDNGGTGFGIWNFSGGSQAPSEPVGSVAPYGRLNHFIDGVDFPTSSYNNLGAPAFGLGNCNPGYHCYGTSVATRPFAQPLQVGDVVSVDIDTPAEYDNYAEALDGYPFAGIGFRDADGLGTFGIEAGGDVEGPGPYPWRYDDMFHFREDYGTDAGVGPLDPTIASDGSTFSLEITSATTGRATLDGVSLDITFQFGLPASINLWLFDNNAVADAMGNPTGQHAFYFNNLKVERPPFGAPGDYNDDGSVDAADYIEWRKNNGTNNGLPNDNGLGTPIGPAHYNLWRQNFGSTAGAAAAASPAHGAPEPNAAWLAAAAVFACLWWRNRRRWRYETALAYTKFFES